MLTSSTQKYVFYYTGESQYNCGFMLVGSLVGCFRIAFVGAPTAYTLCNDGVACM
jgi:hypothetical protein